MKGQSLENDQSEVAQLIELRLLIYRLVPFDEYRSDVTGATVGATEYLVRILKSFIVDFIIL